MALNSSHKLKLAIMQPYFFPYIGYVQLMNYADKFVVYDDVNFIKRGWINRNNFLFDGKANLFTIPLRKASQNKLINQLEIFEESKWKTNLINLITKNYSSAPYFKRTIAFVEDVLSSNETGLSRFIFNSLAKTAEYLSIDTELVPTSAIYDNASLHRQDRIIDICLKEGATEYINPIGGVHLYESQAFADKGIDLRFLRPRDISYTQFNGKFIGSLSIIDVLMFNTKPKIKQYLSEFTIVK